VIDRRASDKLSFTLMLGFMMAAISLAVIPVAAPELEGHLSIAPSGVGLLVSVFLAAYGVMQIPAGLLATRRPRRVLLAAFALMAAGSVVMSLAPGFPAMAAGRLLQGLGAGAVLPASGVMMTRANPPERLARPWGIFGAGWGVGSIIALTLLPMIQGLSGFRTVFAVVAGVSLLLMAVSARVTGVRRDAGQSGAPMPPRTPGPLIWVTGALSPG
jgi:MFS family permease